MEIERVIIPVFIIGLFALFEHYGIKQVNWADVGCIIALALVGIAILAFIILVLRWIILAIRYSMYKMNMELSKND